MGTILFHEPVFGPIHSRRLGSSLGINLMPTQRKCCNFNCIYCECGWNPTEVLETDAPGMKIPSVDEVHFSLQKKLMALRRDGVTPDVITFSGNGEPTLHPDFLEIMKDTVAQRNQFFPSAKICVLSNSGFIRKREVMEGLRLADKRIMKIDSAFPETVAAINQPSLSYSLQDTIDHLKRFKGDFTLQTLFLTGDYCGNHIDNTTDNQVDAWLQVVKDLKPKEVMVYTLDRETPASGLEKCPLERLEEIAAKVRKLGIETNVAG